ncbi:hypothetical protein UY3_15710 [Chelonia mydas]|uniref:Uncharacterized protein n=1 Tax=Chelonia mydas TaxID=8469 RepID=M7AVX0_CHEMY|nr:hypothetical protein UY3_15710 [Chelonia mydas]
MEPVQLTAAVMTIVNTSCIIMQNQHLKNQHKNTKMKAALTVHKRVAIALWKLAMPDSYRRSRQGERQQLTHCEDTTVSRSKYVDFSYVIHEQGERQQLTHCGEDTTLYAKSSTVQKVFLPCMILASLHPGRDNQIQKKGKAKWRRGNAKNEGRFLSKTSKPPN